MAFSNPVFAASGRLVRASVNAPPMRRGEKDKDAVRILQHALVGVGASQMRRSIRGDGTLDGDYGSETVAAVKRFQQSAAIGGKNGGDGIAGARTLELLDARAPHPPVALSLTALPQVTPHAETPKSLPKKVGAVEQPRASDLYREYRKFLAVNGKPCNASWKNITNQCAVRMTIALGRCDIGFHLDNPDLKVHSGRKCGVDTPHDASASRVIAHLKTLWHFQRFSKSGPGAHTADEILALLHNRHGIIFFEDISEASGDSGGDHIDYWNGAVVMNDLLHYNSGKELGEGAGRDSKRFFRRMKQLWFLPLEG